VYNTHEILGQIQGVFHILAFSYTEKFTNAEQQRNVAAPGNKFDFGFGRNLLEFKRPAVDAFSHHGVVTMLVPMPTNILFYDLEQPRAFGSLNQILRDTSTEFLNCLCPRKTGTNGIRTLNGDVLTLISSVWPRAFSWSYPERVSFQGEGKNSFWMDISGLEGVESH